jgi:hypothetical protein
MASSSVAEIHPIKLKGPWTVCFRGLGAPSDEVPTMETVHLPADWRTLFGTVSGTAVFERRFNRPSGLSDSHRVRIVLNDVAGLRAVRLNEGPLTLENRTDSMVAVEITGRMQPHNRLEIELQFDPQDQTECRGGLWQPVILEIEAPVAGTT